TRSNDSTATDTWTKTPKPPAPIVFSNIARGRIAARISAAARVQWRRQTAGWVEWFVTRRFIAHASARHAFMASRRVGTRTAGEVAVARVEVRRDLLQKVDKQALKADQLGDGVAHHRERRVDRLARRARDRRVPVEVIDDGGVERLLLLEERRDRPTDAGDEAAPPSRRWRRADLPQRVERRDLLFVGAGRRVRKVRGQLLNGPVEACERLV